MTEEEKRRLCAVENAVSAAAATSAAAVTTAAATTLAMHTISEQLSRVLHCLEGTFGQKGLVEEVTALKHKQARFDVKNAMILGGVLTVWVIIQLALRWVVK